MNGIDDETLMTYIRYHIELTSIDAFLSKLKTLWYVPIELSLGSPFDVWIQDANSIGLFEEMCYKKTSIAGKYAFTAKFSETGERYLELLALRESLRTL